MAEYIIYELDCPECGFTNQIPSATELVVEWVCGVCESKPITSLPTDGFGELIPSG